MGAASVRVFFELCEDDVEVPSIVLTTQSIDLNRRLSQRTLLGPSFCPAEFVLRGSSFERWRSFSTMIRRILCMAMF